MSHIIDCDAAPYVSKGFTVVEHKKGGQFVWDPAKMGRYVAEGQKYRGKFAGFIEERLHFGWIEPAREIWEGGGMDGNELLKELESQSVMNNNVLHYLLYHQELIPYGMGVAYFWGTIYRSDADGGLYVRGLRFDGICACHRAGNFPVDGKWGHASPAAVFVE